MHGLIEMEAIEGRDGRMRTGWKCDCGSSGSGATPKAAITGFKRHAKTALRKEYR